MSATQVSEAERDRLRILERQLERMRSMLYAYSNLFFTHMRVYTLATLALLAASLWAPLGGAVLLVPFLIPFVFMEASYLFWYTVFARRHAEWLERAIARGGGSGVPLAHRLEAAYFYPPDAPKIAAFSLARPLSHMSVVTLAYSLGAGLLWIASMSMAGDWVSRQPDVGPWLGLVLPAALIWTLAVAAYLVWTWLFREDERRLIAALDAAYPTAARFDPAPAPEASSKET